MISSSFESSIGLLGLAHLAVACGKSVTAGLDTAKWFKKDLLRKPLTVAGGCLDTRDRGISEADIRMDLLKEI